MNSLSWARRGPVVLRAGEDGLDLAGKEVVDSRGEAMPTQMVTLEDGSSGVAFVPNQAIAPLSHARYRVREAAPPHAQAPAQPFTLENETLVAQVDPATGELCRLYDRVRDVELLAPGGRGNRLVFCEDRSEMVNYEPWLIGYTGRVLDGGEIAGVCRVEDGPVRSCVRVARRVVLDPALPPTEIVQDVVLYAGLPYLIFQTRGNWQARRVMLKAEFDLATACTSVVCDMPYGVAVRAPHGGTGAYRVGQGSGAEDGLAVGTTMDEPDRPMGKWLDHGDGVAGVAFLNNGKYGYDASSHQVRLSLMRAPVHRDGVTVGLGPFAFSYALMPHGGDWRAARLPQWGYAFNHALLPIVTDEHPGRALEGAPAYAVSDPGVLITAIKHAEAGTGTVLRLYESLGKHTRLCLRSRAPVLAAASCDLLETPDGGACVRVSDREVDLAFRPFEIKTVLLRHRGPGGEQEHAMREGVPGMEGGTRQR